MTSKKPGIAYIMKYVVFVLIIGFVVLLMLFMSGSNKPFEKVSGSVDFGLNAADYTGVMYYSSGANMSAEEVLLVKVKRDSQVQEVVDAIDERIQSRINDFEGYAPDEVKLLQDAGQSVRGSYIFYACSPDADRYLSIFSGSL